MLDLDGVSRFDAKMLQFLKRGANELVVAAPKVGLEFVLD